MTDLITVAELARMLNRTKRSVYDARYRGGDLPVAIPIGGRLYFAEVDVVSWLDGKRTVARAEMAERQRIIERPVNLTASHGSRQQDKNREPRAFEGDRGSRSTAASRGVSYE